MSSRRAPLLLSLVLSLAPVAARAADVWVASSTEKIRPDAAPRPATQASLEAARNEFEAFQVVVTGHAARVSAEATPLQSGGAAIADVKLYREDLIDLAQPSSLDGGTGRWPDALVPDVDDVVGERRNAFPFDVGDGESRAIWVEYRVPPDAKPGAYRGAVKVTSSEGEAVVPVTLVVWDFVLPSTATLKTHFGLAYGTVSSGHGTSGDADATLRARYAQLGLDHRVSLSGMADDGLQTDLGHFDRFYRPLVDGTAPTRLPGAKLTTVKFIGDPSSVDQQRAWAQHARAGGWLDRLFQYTCDEPTLTCRWDEIWTRANAAKAADPELRTLVTTTIQEADQNGVAGAIDLMVPVVNYMDDKPGQARAGDQRSAYEGFLAGARKELWLYQSCMSHGCGGTVNMGSPSEYDAYTTGWPTYMIDASAVRNRAMEWISFLEQASGELYWETAFAFPHDAWSNQWDFSGNGDGTLFYPGTPSRIGGQTDVPVASIRLKMIREGMEDYEYLRALSDAGDPATARQIARQLFPSAYETEVDPAKLLAAREAIAARILQLSGKQAQWLPAVPGAASPAGAAPAGAASGGQGGLVPLSKALPKLGRH
jgi:hypothetical protein